MAPKTFPNKYAADCATCGGRVQVAEGLTQRGDGKWIVTHEVCPQEAPEAVVQPVSTQAGFTPTAEQADCIKLFATLDDLVIQAGAGAGKTSTLKLLANHANANGRRGVYTAFNKNIVRTTAGSMPGNVTCSTMHGLAWKHYVGEFGHRLNSERQLPSAQARILGIHSLVVSVGDDQRELAAGWLASRTLDAVKKFCSSADRELTTKHFVPVDALTPVNDDGQVDYSTHNQVAKHLFPFAQKAWADLTDPAGKLRFSHDIYLKLWELSSPQIDADFLMLDEAQDADPVQVSIIEQQRQYGTQIVVVGDEQQVIYEWRGAVDALARFEAMGARVAFLSQSFRFGDAVAQQANGLLGRLNARLRITGFGPVASTVGPVAEPDAILTRSNAGAIKSMLAELAAGRRAHLVGGGKEVVWFCEGAQALQAGRSTQHPELACFDSWFSVERYVAEDEAGSDLKLMVKLVNDFTAEVIIDALKHQPREDQADVVVSTAHKSKGLEWDSVRIGADFAPPKDKNAELSSSELRLAYVAVTRAKRQLDLSAVPHFSKGV